MTRTTQELIESYASECENDLTYRSKRLPRRSTRRSARSRRKADVPLGISGRGTRRSTFKAMLHGKIVA